VVFGSGVLVQSLMGSKVIDEYVLLIHPLILGSGHRLFDVGGRSAALTLRSAKSTSNGVVIATYAVQPSSNSAMIGR
jgi:dihydrofolate reductase